MKTKRKKPTNKEITNAIAMLGARLDYQENMLASMSGMFREYVAYMDNEDAFIKYMEKKVDDEEKDVDG